MKTKYPVVSGLNSEQTPNITQYLKIRCHLSELGPKLQCYPRTAPIYGNFNWTFEKPMVRICHVLSWIFQYQFVSQECLHILPMPECQSSVSLFIPIDYMVVVIDKGQTMVSEAIMCHRTNKWWLEVLRYSSMDNISGNPQDINHWFVFENYCCY